MLETIIKLLERFVVAHERIAISAERRTVTEITNGVETVTGPQEGVQISGATADGETLAPAVSKSKTRAPRKAAEPKGPDLDKLRDEIKSLAKDIAAGKSDDCADEFDELLEEFDVRTVTKLKDEDVEAFHKAARDIASKYYEIED